MGITSMCHRIREVLQTTLAQSPSPRQTTIPMQRLHLIPKRLNYSHEFC